jgi:hypothetical protein
LVSHPIVSLLGNRVVGTSAEVVTNSIYLELMFIFYEEITFIGLRLIVYCKRYREYIQMGVGLVRLNGKT